MNQGWINMQGSLIDKPVWRETTNEEKTTFITLLVCVNDREEEGVWKNETMTVKPGQLLTTLGAFARQVHYSMTSEKVKVALETLARLDVLKYEIHGQDLLITALEWNRFDGGEASRRQR
ncbi:hypothetical protein [Sporosarcina sp. ITBMC105]